MIISICSLVVAAAIEFENTFLVVKGLNLDIILGNDFLERNKAVILPCRFTINLSLLFL